MIQRTRLALLLLAAALLSACAGVPVAAEPATAPQAQLSDPTLTPAPSASPTAVPTAVPSATPTPRPTQQPTTPPTVAPTALTRDPLTGAPLLQRGSLKARPWVVMLDNHPDAYPQVGMDGAALVFEALAEYGVTRYMAVYAPGSSPELREIGPVRSARLYFVLWAMGMYGVYVHAGGSPTGLNMSENAIEILNLDALKRSGEAYFRRASDRFAPHNLFTDSTQLRSFAATGSVPEALAQVGYLFKQDAPAAERGTAQSISYYFLYRETVSSWVYDPASNSYARSWRNRPHTDGRTGEQLRFKNLLVIEVQERPIPGDDKGRIEQDVIGSGPGVLFIDGKQFPITWRKDAGFTSLLFFDAQGNELRFNPGAIWVAAVPNLQNLSVR